MATSFVYKWTNLVTGMMYIGVHKGALDDGYVCSSKVMLKEYQERPGDFSRVVLAEFEDYKDARAHEINVLTEIDAAKNPMYYNKSNGTHTERFYRIGPLSDNHKRKISKAHKGISKGKGVPKTIEHKAKISLANKGKPRGKGVPKTLAHREKIGEANKKRIWSIETRNKLALARKSQIGLKRGPYKKKSNGHIS